MKSIFSISSSITVAFLLLVTAWPVMAGQNGVFVNSIRCGRNVIEVGVETYYLLDKCGEPDFREVVNVVREGIEVEDQLTGGSIELETDVVQVTETWVYKQRRGRLTRILTVSGGILTNIRLSDRG